MQTSVELRRISSDYLDWSDQSDSGDAGKHTDFKLKKQELTAEEKDFKFPNYLFGKDLMRDFRITKIHWTWTSKAV